MLDTQAFMQSPYFEEVRSSLAFIKHVRSHAQYLDLPVGRCLCLPTLPKLSEKSGLDYSVIQREIYCLMRLHWIRKYKHEGRTAYIIGGKESLFAIESITKKFRRAQRKRNGAVLNTEWRWLPLEKWNCNTLWQMIFDKAIERNILIKPLGSNIVHRKRLKALLVKVGPSVARRVGVFFVLNYKALEKHFKWYGEAHAGLFCGFFPSINGILERGFPSKQVHDRSYDGAAEQLVEEEWQKF